MAARTNHLSARRLAELARDDTLHLDVCGHTYYVEPPASDRSSRPRATAAPAQLAFPTSKTFELASRPGSQRTIYLDFDGGTISGTVWNDVYNSYADFDAAPYSLDADPAFSVAEHAEIQAAWQIVAEDYAPFDVNVTTKDPGYAAIDRSSSTDEVYGTTAMITDSGPVGDHCFCSGLSYVDVFADYIDHRYYQPALVFTNAMEPVGVDIGLVASHEVGHTFGLSHDGVPNDEYYSGSAPWGPIMGDPFSQAVTQWSSGEYTGASNLEDDIDLIARYAPRIADDHGNNVPTATTLRPGVARKGIISTRSDVDAFTFTGRGATTVAVTPSVYADLDTQLVVKDASGATVATIDPDVAVAGRGLASGMGARWTATLPDGGATYRLYVDGVGTGAPSTPGKYSDYGSLGAYQVRVTTGRLPLGAATGGATEGVVGRAYSATPVTATNGSAPSTFSGLRLPSGLTINATTGRITGTPVTAGSFASVVRVTDATGASVNRSVPIVVRPTGSLTATNLTTPRATVGTAYSSTPATGVGGRAPYSYSATGLPAGLSINASTGRISGIPTTAKLATWTITVSDSAGASVMRKGTIGVASAVPVTAITVSPAPYARVTNSYRATPVQGAEGYQPYSYSATNLPAGLTIDTATGAISGTPTTAGDKVVTVQVRDARGLTATRKFTLEVRTAF